MLTFAQPIFLFALAGLVLPILIHRISRARPIAWQFPSISKIRQTPLPRQGSRSLTDLLLLFLRLLILAFLILSLSGPVWRSDETGSAATSPAESTFVIVVDFSSSMSGWGAIDQTLEFLENLKSSPFGQIGWIVAADSVVAEKLPGSPGDAFDSLQSFLRENEPSPRAGNPEVALQRAVKFAGNEASRKIIIISDFQTSDWNTSLPIIPDSVELAFHRVGTVGRNQNVSVHQVRTLPGDKGRLRIHSEIINFSGTERSVPVKLTVDGSTTSKAIALEPGDRTPVVFEIDEEPFPGEAQVEVPVDTDLYPRDNLVSFSPSAPPPLNVIALNSTGSITEANEEIFFIDQALQIASTQEWIQFSVLPTGPEALNPETLERVAAVIVPSASLSSPSIDWGELKAFSDLGGLILVTLGNDAVKSIGKIESAGFPVGDYLGLAGRDRYTRHYAGPIPENSRLSRIFDGPAARDLYLMTIRQYARIASDKGAIMLLESESGDPLLMSIPSGKGQLVISTFPWDRTGSDFPLRPSFLPVVREVMGLALKSKRLLDSENSLPTIPRSESVTTTVSDEVLTAKFRGGKVTSMDAARSPIQNGRIMDGIQLAPWLLLGAFLFWLSESWLAAYLIRNPSVERGDG